jgi:Flp pilus assembly protein TadD
MVRFCLLLALAGCASRQDQQVITETVENGEAVLQYKRLMAACRAQGRDAGSYAVYAECADAIDADLCRRKSLRCTDGGAP